jgi:hypothetical protein
LTRLDSLDFLGWYGLGECRAFDSAVVRDNASPSGWRFRSSAHSAIEAYMTALRVQPGAHELFSATKLHTLMPVSPTVVRTGLGPAPERARFRAYPTVEPGDTIGFVPYPGASFGLVERTAAAEAALRRNTSLLDTFTASWVQRFPRSARAQEARADALEARAELGPENPRASAALIAIEAALELTSRLAEPDVMARDMGRLRARKVRVHFKRGEFAAARMVADTLLKAPDSVSSRDLYATAALTGRADVAAQYWQGSLRTDLLTGGTVPPAVAVAASRFFSYAALGICDPHLSAASEQLDAALRNYVASDIRSALKSDLTDRAASLATPCSGGKSVLSIRAITDRLTRSQMAFARGDIARTRALLAEIAAQRRERRPGDTSVDYLFHEAWIRTQVGDTAEAIASLDATLGALPTFGAAMFRDLGTAASFGRAMILRAEIATKKGDARTARRWTSAVRALWASADPPLLRTVGRLQAMQTGL